MCYLFSLTILKGGLSYYKHEQRPVGDDTKIAKSGIQRLFSNKNLNNQIKGFIVTLRLSMKKAKSNSISCESF